MKAILILAVLVITGCNNPDVIVTQEKYAEQVKKCEANGGSKAIEFRTSSSFDNDYYRIRATRNNGAEFLEYFDSKK
jgi:hypothetical protein